MKKILSKTKGDHEQGSIVALFSIFSELFDFSSEGQTIISTSALSLLTHVVLVKVCEEALTEVFSWKRKECFLF